MLLETLKSKVAITMSLCYSLVSFSCTKRDQGIAVPGNTIEM